jgi:hypothetical protein
MTDSSLSKNKRKYPKLSIRFMHVVGSPEDARKAFESINSKSKRLDRWEDII